jgi:zinc protease
MVTLVEPRPELHADPAVDVDYTAIPAGGPEPAFDVPKVERRRLPNGLDLVVLEQTELPLARLDLVFRSGTATDPADLGGLCDVASSMLLEGTKKHDKFAFENELDYLGTDLRIWSGDDRTVVSLNTLTKHLDRSLELMAEALLEPALPEDEFADDKERRLVDLRREKDNPQIVAAKVSRRIMYGDDHPYGRMGNGTPESMAAIGLDDVRAWLDANLVPGNATLIAVGDVQIDDLEKRVDRMLGDWSGAAPPPLQLPKPERRTGRTVYLVDKPGDSQSTVRIEHFGLPRSSPDWETVFLANRVLGGFFSSRLNLNLREDKGYTYGVRSYTTEQRGTSTFVMSGRVQTEVTAPALTEFMRELEGVAGARPITADELEFAKSSIVRGYPRDFETIRQLAGALDDQITFDLPDDDLETFPRKIEAAGLDTVNETAQAYYRPEDVAIFVVGDVSKIEESVRALDLGPIRHVDREGNLLDENPELSRR